MTFGAFAAGDLVFAVDDGFTPLDIDAPVELAEEDLDEKLLASGRVPDLDGAPLASWVLARLARLASGTLGLVDGVVEHIDGGVWVVDFVVGAGGAPISKVQLQGGMVGVGLLGVLSSVDQGSKIVGALMDALLADPHDLARCVVSVVDPEWLDAPDGYDPVPDAGAVNRFGFDGTLLLGAENVRPLPG